MISDPYIDVTCDFCNKVTRIEVISHEHLFDTHRRLIELGWYMPGQMREQSRHCCPKCYGAEA
jgi:hypothetical protein